jgi:hypothetical protein
VFIAFEFDRISASSDFGVYVFWSSSCSLPCIDKENRVVDEIMFVEKLGQYVGIFYRLGETFCKL